MAASHDNVLDPVDQRQKTLPPRLFNAVLYNDDFTPMEFVVEVLIGLFGLSADKAVDVMMSIHLTGKGVAGTYSRDIAETRASQCNDLARQQGHPLLCKVEQA